MVLASGFRVVTQTADQLVITMPGSSLLIGWMAFAIAAPVLLIFYLTSRTVARVTALEHTPAEVTQTVLRYRLFGLGVTAAALLIFWAVSYSSGSIQLDRTSGQAMMKSRMTVFLPAQTQSRPLPQVSEAVLDQKPNSRRVRLLVHDGADLAFPVWTGRTGQDAAVQTINAFLRMGNR
jgi:hypothetical protein